MAAKIISVSLDDITYYTLPGNTGEHTRGAGALEDTIFGETFKSQQPGIITWGISANAYFKGFPGYVATLKKKGTSTTMTDEACALVTGKTYRISAAAKRVIDRSNALIAKDNGVDKTTEVKDVDFLNGEVTFKSSYTVTGPVVVTGRYFPLVSLGKYTSYTLTQTAVAIKDTDIPAAKANGGRDTFRAGGLREVALALPSVFDAADGWEAALTAREEYIVEINPDGTGAHFARGFFKLFDDKQNGDVGALEEESLTFNLAVPQSVASQLAVATPFKWYHAVSPIIPNAVKTLLDAWETEVPVYVKYLHDGVNGWKGSGVVTNMTMSGGLESVNMFTVSIQGSGAQIAVP